MRVVLTDKNKQVTGLLLELEVKPAIGELIHFYNSHGTPMSARILDIEHVLHYNPAKIKPSALDRDIKARTVLYIYLDVHERNM